MSHGGRDRARGHQHERHRGAGAPGAGAGGRAERADGAAGPGPGRDAGRAGPDRPRPREGPRARMGPDRGDSCRVPVAGHRREDPDGVAGHRPGRHLGHRQLGKEGAAPTWKKGYGFHPLGAWLRQYARTPGHAAPPRERRLEHVHRPPGRTGRRHPAGSGPVPAQDPHPRRRGRRQPRPHQAPAVPVLAAAHSAVQLRVDDHRRRRGRDPAGPRIRVEARHRPGRHRRGRQGRRGDHRPDDPGRELARRPAVDRPAGQAVPAATCGT